MDVRERGRNLKEQDSSARSKLNPDNEITIQSEAVEDHPSSASYYTETKNCADDMNKTSSSNQLQADIKISNKDGVKTVGPSSAAAKMMGLTGHVQHDRHLLVSPALSPAPSICQSPAQNYSFTDSSIRLDIGDLNEAFKTLTFGLPDNNQAKPRIKQPERPQSELHTLYASHLVQNQEDLTNCITVIFTITDNHTTSLESDTRDGKMDPASRNISSDIIANQVYPLLRSICLEQSFNLRFLNMSQDHISQNILVNNLPDVAMNILEKEYQNNSERLIFILMANGGSNMSYSHPGDSPAHPSESISLESAKQNDKRLLPVKINAQSMNSLFELDASKLKQKHKDLLKSWYHTVGNFYYLKPVYSVDPSVLDGSKEEHQACWGRWISDSDELVGALSQLCETDSNLANELRLKSLSDLYIDFLLKESKLQRRTLLIRNYAQPNSAVTNPLPHQFSSQGPLTANKASLSDLARQLPDPNKLAIKRVLNEQEFFKTINEWITENFNKYLESFLESRITMGKYCPPFIERNLFIELTRQRHLLESYLDSVTEGFESKCQNFYTSQIYPMLKKFLDGSSNGSEVTAPAAATSEISGSRQSFSSTSSANHLVLISGPRGCGKTTLFAQLIKLTAQDLFNQVQIIYRFCGSTLDTLNSDRLLRSICEQFCQTQGENTAAASYIYSARRDIMNSLNKILKRQSCLIFLDGVELFEQLPESSLDWLCELEASENIRIFIMLETDSNLYKKALSSYTDATYITLDSPTLREWAQMLAQTARSKRLNSAANLYGEVKNLCSNDSACASDISYRDVCDTINMCYIRRLNNEYIYPELNTSKLSSSSITDFKNIIHQGVLRHLHYIISPPHLCSFFIMIDSSRNGLREHDIVEIMDLLISQISQKYPETRPLKFSPSLLEYLKIQLKPWLRFIVCDKVVKLTLQRDFLTKAILYYIPNRYPKLVNEVREVLLEYFGRPFRSMKKKSADSASRDNNISRAEALWLDTQVSETMNLLVLTNPTKAKEFIMSKENFYLQFLHRSNPEEFIEDYERLKSVPGRKGSQSNDELISLVKFISQSVFPLRYDGNQIYSQIYCRSYEASKSAAKSKSRKFNEILSQASNPPIRNLLPASDASIDSFVKTRIGLNSPPKATMSSNSIISNQSNSNTQQQSSIVPSPAQSSLRATALPNQQPQSRQKIFTINDNHKHVIVIFPDRNCISIWDIFEEKAVRVINNVDQPRDLRMIDQKRAVVLCNRELRVYDLDSGQLLTKLKGVMNQKMPYFEVFAQQYVIALARNRMYVNMLNLETGELETTFKVGEDRFLNSLLVSANGGICVCGDETQKPFPLLVWNLNERRLMYDLRLDRHEFITRMSAISDDGHFVVSVCKQLGSGTADGLSSTGSSSIAPASSTSSFSLRSTAPNFIVIYDLNSGTLFKKWKPGLDTCAVAITLSANRSGKVMNTLVDSTILVWDLSTGSKR